jgi:streptomycin 6-kinase
LTNDEALAPWLAQWGLTLDGPPPTRRYQGATDAGLVAFVKRDAQRLVLKLTPPVGDEANLGAALRHWAGRGAVALVEAATGAVLMERALPGDDLEALCAAQGDDAATAAACEVMAALRQEAPVGGPFRTIGDWGRGFRRVRRRALAIGFPAELIDGAERRFASLMATQAKPILLHGDLHHENIVRDARLGWLSIDPKGVLGEPAYETGSYLRNPRDQALCARPEIIERRARMISDRLGYGLPRILGWCFSQWVLSCLWAIEDSIPFDQSWLEGPRSAEQLL